LLYLNNTPLVSLVMIKHIRSLLVFLLTPLLLSAQTDTTGIALFDKAINLIKNKNNDSSLVIFKKIVAERIGAGSYVYGNSFFNIPTLFAMQEKYDSAKLWYKKVLVSDLKDNDETGELMEPHTNYKHKSAIRLASLYDRDSNFSEALKWVYLADTVYRYWGFEGSATNVSKKQASLLLWKSYLFSKLDKPQETVHVILFELISSGRYEGFFDESEEELLKLLGSDRAVFKETLDKAIGEAIITPLDKTGYDISFKLKGRSYIFHFRRQWPEKDIPHFWHMIHIGNDTVDKDYFIAYIKGRSFYKKISE
jgi:hypothetical protein